MYISKFQVFNYKSFKDSTLLEFKPGINIIIGQNNAGKTAFLEALELKFENIPHKNIKALLSKKKDEFLPLSDFSNVDIRFQIEKSDIYSLIEQSTICVSSDYNCQQDLDVFQNWITQTNIKEICVSNYRPKKDDDSCTININMPKNINISYPHNYDGAFKKKGIIQKIIIDNDNNLKLNELPIDFKPYYESIDKHFFDDLRHKIYRFESERFHIGECYAGTSVELKQSAVNLAEVISQLQLPGRTGIYQQFNEYVNIIFPDIAFVSARPKPKKSITNDKLLHEVLIWSLEAYQQDMVEMALPLADCGTGVSQVLAILYVIITASEPQVIIIDEPQSFLHPSAAKKLIEILKEFPQHQYFIATHSPQIITTADPTTIVQLSYIDGETTAKIIDANETTQLRSLLSELGVSLSDVFGADNILWVEGLTEEKCFPLILEKLTDIKLRGTQILAVQNTGDLEGKHANLVFDIYNKLSGGNTLLPPAIGFIFDDEGRKKSKKDDLIKRSNNKLVFLERKLYENYLLDPKAIAHVLNQEDSNRDQPISEEKIQNWLDESKNKNLDQKSSNVSDWLKDIHGAKILDHLFAELTESRVEFKKTKHSYELTKWLVENNPACLQEIVDLLKKILAPHP